MKIPAGLFSPRSLIKLVLLLVLLPAVASAAEIQAWLMLNSFGPESLMSTDVLEKNNLVRAGWKVTGTGMLQTEGDANSGQLFRMVKTDSKGVLRMLAVTKAEAEIQVKAGYVIEGALGYVATQTGPGHIAVYRFMKADKLLWLIGSADQTWAVKNGWTREKAVFWLWPDNDR
ncbi:MAG: hypothetical protein ABI222_17440 [Opitutaceae bacterium]